MIRKIKKIIGYFLNKEKVIYYPFTIAGVNLRGLKFTKRKKTDQDDAWYFALVANNSNVYDIGCNRGYMSLLAAMQKCNKNVVLIDPNPEALAMAAQNMIINGFGIKSKFINAFVGSENKKEIKFYTVGSGEAGSMFATFAETASALNSFYYVEQHTIDSIYNNIKIIPDFIKLDVEGAEYFALQGATQVAKEFNPLFLVEMHSNKELTMLQNASNVLHWCNENNYNAYYLTDKKIINNPEAIANRGKCHLLLTKAESLPSYLLSISQGDELPKNIN